MTTEPKHALEAVIDSYLHASVWLCELANTLDLPISLKFQQDKCTKLYGGYVDLNFALLLNVSHMQL